MESGFIFFTKTIGASVHWLCLRKSVSSKLASKMNVPCIGLLMKAVCKHSWSVYGNLHERRNKNMHELNGLDYWPLIMSCVWYEVFLLLEKWKHVSPISQMVSIAFDCLHQRLRALSSTQNEEKAQPCSAVLLEGAPWGVNTALFITKILSWGLCSGLMFGFLNMLTHQDTLPEGESPKYLDPFDRGQDAHYKFSSGWKETPVLVSREFLCFIILLP